MIRHYLKVALRNMSKQKVPAFINIIGLSIGIACFTLFLFYAVNEFSFDKFNANANNIYRVYNKAQGPNGTGDVFASYLPMPVGPALKKDFPEVENFVRLQGGFGNSFVKVSDNDVRRLSVTYADPSLFFVFTFKFIYGSATDALQGLQSLVLTKSKAEEMFGTSNVIGRTVQIKVDDKFQPFTVTAVTEDNPPNSSITYDLVCNFHFFETMDEGKRSENNWHRSAFQTYVQLKPGSGLPNDPKKFVAFFKKYNPDYESDMEKFGIKWDHSKPVSTYALQPLLAMHTDTKFGDTNNIDPKTIWILLSIATGVLLIACINFTTLAIGRFAGRAKEVGVRKVIGGEKKQLITQFLSEAIILAVISALLGLIIAKLLLPYFNNLSGRNLVFSFDLYPQMIWMLIAVTLLVGLLAGSYPALILSNFKPIEVLKSKIRIGGSNLFTKSLVTIQFALSIGLIISTIVILQQTKYMSSKNPGFNKENVVMIDASDVDTKKIYPLFKQSLASNTNITGTTSAELGLGEGEGWSRSGFEYNGKHKDVYEFFIDPDYLNVLGMNLLAGRNFDPHISSDTVNSVIINEAMMNDFGWTINNAIGQQIKGYSDTKMPVVIGVVKDFNFRPLSEKVEPQMFQEFSDYSARHFFVRIKPGEPSAAIAAIQKTWKQLVPDYPLKYDFLDESLNNFYKSEQRWSSIVGWAGGVSIFLACLGLFGLASLAAVNRTKEIGIRKVLGASVTNIISLLSQDFIVLVALALLIASPVSWYFMNKWLQDYAYRINIGWSVFILSGFFAVAVALLTISFQAIRAASANIVKSLRTE